VFGYDDFKPLQEVVIQSALAGKDALVILPTGGGKSLCYQVPALCSQGITLVISPLIALMNDQVLALQQAGVVAHAIHTNISEKEKYIIHDKLQDESMKLLYVSPEKAMTPSFINYISGYDVTRIAIDEAHCVSVWGNDFRPEYIRLAALRETFPKATFMALTATADKATQEDIVTQLRLKEPDLHIGSFERENIFIEARQGTRRIEQIVDFLSDRDGEAGIIYCLSRKATESVASRLLMEGYKADFYHAGMESLDRNSVQEKFQNDEIQIVCATIAFGMGIDKSNIRWIIHYNMPKNLEGFYQEIGRSGRDGLPAASLLFYSWGDHLKLQRFIDDSQADEKFKEIQTAKLSRMWEFAYTGDCRMNVILNYFDEYRSRGCEHCDNCLHPPQKIDGTIIAQKALSALKRCNESVGLNLLVDVLRGSGKSEIMNRRLNLIKTYGSGRDLPFLEWKNYISQMINQGFVRVDYIDNFNLKTTPLSADVLLGRQSVEFVKFEVKTKAKPTQFKKATKTEDFQQDLMDKLKAWRLEKARRLGTPAYTIFHDSSLQELASVIPTLESDLRHIHGFGETKIAKYGSEILAVIRDYVEHQTHLKKVKGQTHYETFKLYQAGKSVDDIAEERGLSVTTIYGHLVELFTRNEKVNIAQYVTQDKLDLIKSTWIKLEKPDEIKKLKERLPDDIAFYEINIAVAIFKKVDEYLES
jgi:ATP-dependent DNA helicase RecQ